MKDPGRCQIENAIGALKEAIENRKTQMQDSTLPQGPSVTLSHLFSEVSNRAGGFYGQTCKVLEHGGEYVHDFMKKAEQTIQEDPWEALRKVAVYSFAIGLFLSLRHRKTRGEKE